MTAVDLDRSAAVGRLEVFASAPDDARARRPIDGIRAAISVFVLIVVSVLAELGRHLDTGASSVLLRFPPVLRLLWLSGFWLGLAWAVALFVLSVLSNRGRLAIQILAAATLAAAACVVVAAIVHDDADRVLTDILDTHGPPTYPPALIAAVTATVATAAPYVTVPTRRFGRALVAGQVVGSLFLGVTRTSGAAAAIAAGALAGAIVHVIVGSPGGFPTPGRVGASLRQLGVRLDDLAPVRMRRGGVALLSGHDRDGRVDVKVYGRDAWDGELLAGAWQKLWYRDNRHDTKLRRSEMAEHEGFMTFLAGRAGVRVPDIVTAGRADNGDAIIVSRAIGEPLDPDDLDLSADEIEDLWEQLSTLHRAGIAHRRVDLDRIVRIGDGTVAFSDLSSSTVQATQTDLWRDRAQVLAVGVLALGEEPAIAIAREALGDAELVDLLPFVQEAALPPVVREALEDRDVDFDDVRQRLTDALGAEQVELIRLRRVTWMSLLNIALLTIAAYTIIGMLGGIDYGMFSDALRAASWWWLAFALLIGQLPRVASAFSATGSSRAPLPLGPTVALQFANCYINLTVPSSAGRVALTTRYFQRNGVDTSSALAAGFIDTLAQTLLQITLFVLIFFASDVDLGFTLDTDQLSGVATVAMIALAAIVVAIVLVAFVPAVRRRVMTPLRRFAEAFAVLRMPGRVLQLIGGNLASEILFAITLATVTRAFGHELPLSAFVLINATVSLFSSVIPVPGGIGVMEAGLALGLSRAGIPDETAFAIALSHRFITFYLPPFWGYAAYRWLVKSRFL